MTVRADNFNPTKVCELRLVDVRGRPGPGVSKKDYVLFNGSYSLSLACSTHPAFFSLFLPLSREHSLKKSSPKRAP